VFPVEAELTSADGQIKPGMTADARIHLEKKPGVLTLPVEAILKENKKTQVLRVVTGADGKQTTEKVDVTLGTRNDREVEVVTGLQEGARVLVSPPSAAENERKM
jgi:multidrug efflux pump subunit AcrA (membrane-fusion protein)